MGDGGRFRADRDLIVATDMPGFYADPAADPTGRVTKAGFDLTRAGRPTGHNRIPPRLAPTAAPRRHQPRGDALKSPMHFGQILAATGSTDGREIALELDVLREEGIPARLDDGEWTLKTEATT